jgi:hypothetical protein
VTKRVRDVPDTAPPLFSDMADQFEPVKSMANGQREFLHGVIEFYQTRTSTHTAIAAEKVASTGVQQNDDMRKITAWVARSSPSHRGHRILRPERAVPGLRNEGGVGPPQRRSCWPWR